MKFLIWKNELFGENHKAFSNLLHIAMLQPEKLLLAFAGMTEI
jgi:hypothetical protein